MARSKDNSSGWIGWVAFASFMLLLMGTFSSIAGLVALFKDTVVYNSASNVTWILDYTQWGWVHIVVGLLAILAASSLLAGHMYGRITAVVVAFLSAVVNMAFIPIYPLWSIVLVTINVLVMYAVIVHGGDLREG